MIQAATAAAPLPPKPLPSHPPYAQMIIAAIRALKERQGSSKKAIAKYIDSVYSNLPPSHSALLTHHLKRLKKNGALLQVKKSYKLPNPSVSASTSGSGLDSGDQPIKRGRGRPPKPKAVVGPDMPVPGVGYVAVEKRGRGRPPKFPKPKPVSVVGSTGVATLQKRGRGRPPKPKPNVIVGPGLDRVAGPSPRPRGRPKKNVSGGGGLVGLNGPEVVEGAVVVPPTYVSVGRPRGRGRPPKVGGPVKPKRVSTGRPVGRPRKVTASPPVALVAPVAAVE